MDASPSPTADRARRMMLGIAHNMRMPEIRYCTTSDGIRIAYSDSGAGYPFLWIPGWVSHRELDAGLTDLMHKTAPELRVIALDKRGTGLSERNLDDYSLEARLRDLDAVVDAAGIDRFAVGGWSEGGPLAIAYAAAHPEHVTHLCVLGSYADGAGIAGSRELQAAVLGVVRAEWGMGAKLLCDLFLDDASFLTADRFREVQLVGANKRDAHLILDAAMKIDVRGLLPKITAPTLVQHGRDDRVLLIDAGQAIAAGIKGARFISYPGGHVPSAATFAQQFAAMGEFITGAAPPPPERADAKGSADTPARPPSDTPTRPSLRTVLFTDLVGHTEMMQRLGDERGRAVLREHERITRDLLRQHGGAEVKTMGDGFMASFASVTAAMECAIALQRAISSVQLPDSSLQVRVGLNAGEPIEEDGDLFGATVILASRIAAKADAGEILVPDTVRGLLSGKGFVFGDRGEFIPRGFDEGVRLWDVRWQEA